MKISKEKTAKIIPNAVGVATIDERHVFGSFMSREAAYRLMLSVWRPISDEIPLAAAAAATLTSNGNVEISECSIEEDSSSAISGNESPSAAALQMAADSTTSTDATNTVRHRMPTAALDQIDGIAGITTSSLHSTPAKVKALQPQQLPSSRSTSPAPRIVRVNRFYQIPLPDRCINIGICLSIVLAILSIFLFYRIWSYPTRLGPTAVDPSSIPIAIKWVSFV